MVVRYAPPDLRILSFEMPPPVFARMLVYLNGPAPPARRLVIAPAPTEVRKMTWPEGVTSSTVTLRLEKSMSDVASSRPWKVNLSIAVESTALVGSRQIWNVQ